MCNSVQTNFFDCYSNLVSIQDNNVLRFIDLLDTNFNLNNFVPLSFYAAFYKSFGRKRKYNLLSFLNALLIKNLFKIPTIKALIIYIRSSPRIAAFCNFSSVPDATKFSKFLSEFSSHITDLFNIIASSALPISEKLDPKLASTLILDTTGVKACVKENNPKFVNASIKNLKKLTKSNKDFNPYSYAYSHMPSLAASKDFTVPRHFVNGEFCYAHKLAIITNGLGIPLYISPLDGLNESRSPDKDKDLSDSKALKPIVTNFLNLHKSFAPYTFLGDSGFDCATNYDFLIKDCGFERVAIPLNPRNSNADTNSDFDEYGSPFCKTCNKSFVFVGKSNGKGRSPRLKFACPLSSVDKSGKRTVNDCQNKCTTGNCRYRYAFPNGNLRLYPGSVPRGTAHFENIYKRRTIIEREIFLIKDCSNSFESYSRNKKTILSNFVFGAISRLAVFVLANSISAKSYLSFNALLKSA